MIKYVNQNDPFLLPKVLDKYLREFADTTAGVNIQSVAQANERCFKPLGICTSWTASTFQWKVRCHIIKKSACQGPERHPWFDQALP